MLGVNWRMSGLSFGDCSMFGGPARAQLVRDDSVVATLEQLVREFIEK